MSEAGLFATPPRMRTCVLPVQDGRAISGSGRQLCTSPRPVVAQVSRWRSKSLSRPCWCRCRRWSRRCGGDPQSLEVLPLPGGKWWWGRWWWWWRRVWVSWKVSAQPTCPESFPEWTGPSCWPSLCRCGQVAPGGGLNTSGIPSDCLEKASCSWLPGTREGFSASTCSLEIGLRTRLACTILVSSAVRCLRTGSGPLVLASAVAVGWPCTGLGSLILCTCLRRFEGFCVGLFAEGLEVGLE